MSKFLFKRPTKRVISAQVSPESDSQPKELRARAKCYDNDEHYIELHFSEELPITPQVMYSPNKSCHISLRRSHDMDHAAKRMAEENAGKSSREWSDPEQKYRNFLNELVFIKGVETIIGNQRYSIRIEVGELFELSEVADSVAICIHHHLFPDTELSVIFWTIPVFHERCRTAGELEDEYRTEQEYDSPLDPDRYDQVSWNDGDEAEDKPDNEAPF